jgi:formylglycine-generating enzyme required for sulfatase activity
MQRWFLSYHSPDQTLAERLRAAIEAKGAPSRVFFAPQHIRAGGFWTAQLAQEIADATAFILLVGENGLGPWQVLEYYEALDRRVREPDFPLALMLREGVAAPGLPFLRRLHWIVSADPASEKDVARLFDAAAGAGSTPGELWRHTSPYRGLEAMTEKDSDYFFGRTGKAVEVIEALAAPGRIPVLIGNSGVGKSSLAQAGVLAALKRQAWPQQIGPERVLPEPAAPDAWPHVFRYSRQWCFLTLRPGTEPLRALVKAFFGFWQFDATDPERSKLQNGWIELLHDGKQKHALTDLIDATERRQAEREQSKPPSFFLYIDQGEELYTRAEEHQRRRFSQILVEALADPRLRIMVSMRSDFLGDLQKDEPLFDARQQIDVPPLREAQLREVVSRPANLLSARFETDGLIDIITRRTAEDSVKDVGALPLLSYTLDDMWKEMVERGDGTLRLPAQSFELGGVLVARANAFVAAHPGAEDDLRRVLTLRCATVREDGEPTRRRAPRAEFSDAEWNLVSELADHPNRLLVTAIPEGGGEPYAEVAHEAIFRRWNKLREWIAVERKFLAWRSGLEAARGAWQAAPDAVKQHSLLMGAALTQAQDWLARRAEDLSKLDREFIVASIDHERRAQARARRGRALVYALLVGIIAGLVGWINQAAITEQLRLNWTERRFAAANIRPYVMTLQQERALEDGAAACVADRNPDRCTFRECAAQTDYCPEMVVIPAGPFMMGSGKNDTEKPPHLVTIAQSFAVAKFALTFAEWETCVDYGDCDPLSDSGFGRERRPVINVAWNEAQRYVAWLRRVTGKEYRLISEAEYEYAARAGTQTEYPWGDDIKQDGKIMANCNGCGSQWDNRQTAPVGSFAPNRFGLYDMVGNVFEWVEDCVHNNYQEAPNDGTTWLEEERGNCGARVVRGGSWTDFPQFLRAAGRNGNTTVSRSNLLGFRVGRTLTP